jgi:hypothetical protein
VKISLERCLAGTLRWFGFRLLLLLLLLPLSLPRAAYRDSRVYPATTVVQRRARDGWQRDLREARGLSARETEMWMAPVGFRLRRSDASRACRVA